MKRSIVSMIISIFAVTVFSTPTWMWIGRYNDETNICGPAHPYGDLFGMYFWNGAHLHHPNGPNPFFVFNLENKEVTYSHLRGINGFWQRDECDFLFFVGHGDVGHICGWNDAQTACAQVPVEQLNFHSYTRWVYVHGCFTLNEDGNWGQFWNKWFQSFKGVQVVMGHRWYSPGSQQAAYFGSKFWQLWAKDNEGSQEDLQSAYFHAVEYSAWEYGGEACEPALIDGKTISGVHPYPWSWDSYTEATSQAANDGCSFYWWASYGDPE
ncbi:MAG: hypothetical protein JW913_07770 [Chitinispirillaceae bacterium]|nr:hypothetical protein [Chitinispirillaceae bacterium]